MPPTDIEPAWKKFPGYAITATPFDGVGRVTFNGVVVAESERAVVVAESDHRDQLYFPPGDVRWELLTATDRDTVCPFKGHASYWSLTVNGETLDDVAWSYADPFDEVAAIAGYVAFYSDRVAVGLIERWGETSVAHRFPVWGSMADLIGLMDVGIVGEGRFVAPTYPDPPYGTFFEWATKLTARNVVEGGQLLGDIVVAAAKSDPSKRVTSAYATFLKAASFDEPIDVAVEVLRRGRSVTTIEARLTQAGSLRCAGMALLDVGSDDVLRVAAPMPDVAGPDESPPLDMGVLGRDLREVGGSYAANRGELGPPEVYVWARYKDAPAEQYLQQAVVAQMSTHWSIAAAMRPHDGITELDAHRTVSTGPLTVSIAFHDDIDITEWMLYANPAVYAGRGSVQGEGRVFSIDGRLLASYTVQAMVRPFDAPPDAVGGSQRAM